MVLARYFHMSSSLSSQRNYGVYSREAICQGIQGEPYVRSYRFMVSAMTGLVSGFTGAIVAIPDPSEINLLPWGQRWLGLSESQATGLTISIFKRVRSRALEP